MSAFPLFKRLPKFEELSNDLILDRFLDYSQEKKLELYPAQEEAILSLIDGQNVILNTPTGSGKSLVATALHFDSLSKGKRSIYTCPIKALVNEKFLALCKEFGPDQVGMSTGDGSVNRDAPILCCTAEILANMALREGELANVDDIVMDEFHYYSDRERGVAWQIPLLVLPRARFLLMSATLGEMDFFKDELTKLTGRETSIVSSTDRPVPLKYEYRETPLHETIQDLLAQNSAPVYLVCFTQRETAEEAQNLMSVNFTTKEQKGEILEALKGVEFSSPYGKEIAKFLKHGVGIHHAGLLPKYRVLVERLAQTGLLKVICGTDTLGVGVNIPIRTVLFTKLCKYDGEKTGILSVRDFKQISGRAGRRGFDTEGRVVAQAPDHVIENLKIDAKIKADPKKGKKIVRAKPPEKGFVMWSADTFNKLVTGKPEALQSRFQVSHGMLLNVLSRPSEDGCLALRKLIRDSHDAESAKKKHRTLGFTLFRSLVDRKLVEIIPGARRGGKRVRVNVELQEDFSLNNALSLYLIDTINLLDPMSETYALDVLTLLESILESPDLILRKQLDRVKTLRMGEMKAAGMEYEERMEELEKCEHPKPLRDFIYQTFNEFSDKHPWVGTENIRPKSIAREMYETYQSFAEYVREYELQRAEGLLLRYLSDVYRNLVQTVPQGVRNDELDTITEYFASIVRSVDSSLIDEWERIRNGGVAPVREAAVAAVAAVAEKPVDPLADKKLLRVKIMNEVFRFLRSLAIGDFEASIEILRDWGAGDLKDGEGQEWTDARLRKIGEHYASEDHKALLTDPSARRAEYTRLSLDGSTWRVEQTLVDPDGHNDWQLVVAIDPEASRLRHVEEAKLSLRLESIAPV
jgi:superfamily II RNA helicase